ncbi:hypothetical protein TNCV_731071 [Trichonephila clavipes]|nr:hypothetical protein TNCV_731071 [Trichonephila clavipes]
MGGVIGSTRNGRRDTRRLGRFGKTQGESAACVWAAANEAVGSTHVTVFWRRMRRCPEPGRRVNDVSSVYWSQHLPTAKSELAV